MVSLATPAVLSPSAVLIRDNFELTKLRMRREWKGGVYLEKQVYGWQRAVQAAIDENEGSRTDAMIREAEVSIFERISSFCSADHAESKALFEALRSVRALNRRLLARAVETSEVVFHR